MSSEEAKSKALFVTETPQAETNTPQKQKKPVAKQADATEKVPTKNTKPEQSETDAKKVPDQTLPQNNEDNSPTKQAVITKSSQQEQVKAEPKKEEVQKQEETKVEQKQGNTSEQVKAENKKEAQPNLDQAQVEVKVQPKNNPKKVDDLKQDQVKAQPKINEEQKQEAIKEDSKKQPLQIQQPEFKLPQLTGTHTPQNMQSYSTSIGSPFHSDLQQRMNKQLRGVTMLDTLKSKKHVEVQALMLENRLKRLEFEETKAMKKIKETIERTKQFEKIKGSKDLDRSRIQSHRAINQQKIEENRIQLQYEKDQRARKMQELAKNDFMTKQKIRMSIEQTIENQLRQKSLEKQYELQRKRSVNNQIKAQLDSSLHMRKQVRATLEFENHKVYNQKHKEAADQISIYRDKINEMARKEQELISRLQSTQKAKEDALQGFKSVIGEPNRKAFTRKNSVETDFSPKQTKFIH